MVRVDGCDAVTVKIHESLSAFTSSDSCRGLNKRWVLLCLPFKKRTLIIRLPGLACTNAHIASQKVQGRSQMSVIQKNYHVFTSEDNQLSRAAAQTILQRAEHEVFLKHDKNVNQRCKKLLN